MASSVTLGAPVAQVDVVFIRNSDQAFAMEITDDQGNPDPPSGSVLLEFADGTTWPGSIGGADGNIVTWSLLAADTTPDWSSCTVSTVRVDGTIRVVLGAGTARCVP